MFDIHILTNHTLICIKSTKYSFPKTLCLIYASKVAQGIFSLAFLVAGGTGMDLPILEGPVISSPPLSSMSSP